MLMSKPSDPIMSPMFPNRCSGRLRKVTRNRIVRRSMGPRMKGARQFPDPEALGMHDDRNIAVQLAVNVEVLDHFAAVSLEAAIEVLEVEAAEPRRHVVEQLRRQGLPDRVVSFLLP